MRCSQFLLLFGVVLIYAYLFVKYNLRLRDEVVVLCRELELVIVGQFGRGLHHDLLELLERIRPRVVRKFPSRNLYH